MKGKASDICTKCKHCEGLDMFAKMYSCKHYNNYPDAAIGMDSEIECTNFEEVNMNKVEGKVGDFCLNCKNCKAVTRTHDGKTASMRIIEVDCEDPYDGMVKTLQVDSDICCSMFEPKPSCEKCERFDGTYCHSPNGIFVTSYMGLFGDYTTANCPSYEEKKEKTEPFNLNMPREQLEAKILDLFEEKNRLNGIINSLEKEKAAHLKGIERLKKSQEKLQTANEESYKREEKLEDKVHKDNEFLMSLAHVLYPGERIFKSQDEVLRDIKLLNKGVYDLKEDNKRLADRNKALFEENLDRLDKHTKQCQEIDDLKNKLVSLNTINKGLAEDRKKLINYMRSLKIASENYLKEFTYEED